MPTPDITGDIAPASAPHDTGAYGRPAEPRTENGAPETPEALLTKTLGAGNSNPGPHPIPANAISHGECKRWWTGAERSHASCCHETFSSLSAFDAHRKGGTCNPPASVGLVARQKPFGTLWGWPAPEGGMAARHGSRREQDDPAELERAVEAFNAAHPVGTPVVAYPACRPEEHPGDTRLVTTTRSKAEVLGGHTPVVWVDGHDACIALTHINPIEETSR